LKGSSTDRADRAENLLGIGSLSGILPQKVQGVGGGVAERVKLANKERDLEQYPASKDLLLAFDLYLVFSLLIRVKISMTH
jgi:hypothetical protein